MLRIKRKKLLLTQKEVSKLLGISNTYLSMIENGHRCNLTKDLIIKIRDIYQLSGDEFKILFPPKK
ncbi:helix-turn-helix domain-containing protein [Romboutsia lituseburensis]|uniref:helix-turn-helix domain-containing protein n=1 Tax=Romboutsia lituseburensis TaxID=1537 RepID=UPI0022EB69EE|nr:helix-turn-helix transcriptional regulator [Romboutsia lituseburensis]